MDKNNFFAKVNVPTFDSNYASSFEQFVETINNNFTRIASLPFLKGDNGSSIIIHKEKLYDEKGKFTTFGILLVKAIYKELAGKTFSNFDELKSTLHSVYPGSEPVNGVYSCEQLNPKKTTYIPVYHDQYTGEKHLCVPYIFQDSRKTVLQGNYLSTYVDQTKYVIGDSHKKEEGVFSWRFETSDFIPSLYYDESNSMYCWSINGEKSGITAQGVKGEDGNSSKVWLCKGEIPENYDDYIKLKDVFVEKDSVYDFLPVEKSEIAEGDLAIVTFLNSEEENDVLFGPVIIATGAQADYLVKISGNNLLSIKNTNDFHALMKSAGKSNSGSNDVLGLYTFGRTKEYQNQENEGSERIPHMFWVDENENTAHIAPVGLNDLSNPTRESIQGEFEIKLDYKNVTAQENVNTQNLHASKNVFIGDNSVIKEEQGDKIPSNINVTDNLTCVLVPSTNITQVEFGGNLIQDNNEATPESIMITMDLPSLGIKTPNGDIICFDKAESLEGGSNINIGLKLEELNCNWNENDNTSWGGRSYFDVDLYASSATFNSNGEQSVYVGSKELPIKTTINGTDYFAKLQVSAIRYDVAFNEDNEPLFVRGFYNAKTSKIDSETILTTDLVRTAGSLRDAVKQFKNTRASASIDEITISGNNIKYNNNDTNINIMSWQFSVNDIKTITDIIIYIKPYNNNNTDLFRLIYDYSLYGETPDFLQGVFNMDRLEWKDGYYTCTRYRFINNEISSYNEPSQNGDSKYEVFDINTLNTLSDTTGGVISDVIYEQLTGDTGLVEIVSPEYLKGKFNIIDSNTINVGSRDYTIAVSETAINGKYVVSSMKSNFEIKTTSGTATDNYIILKKSVGLPPNMKFVIYKGNAPARYIDIYAAKDTEATFDIKCDDIIIISGCKVKTYNNSLYLEVTFSSDAVDGGKLVAEAVSANSPIGTNNTKYRKILNSNYNNTIDVKLLNSSQLNFQGNNIYSPKFNNYSWTIGCSIYKYNDLINDSMIYRSGVGCGKILPFPKQTRQGKNGSIEIRNQHSIIPNSNWYLLLPAKKLSMSELGLNDYLSITPNGRINLTLSNNCVVTNLPQNKKCYHCEFWNIGKNKQVVTSNISNVSFIDEISGDPEEPVTNLGKPVLNSVDFIVTQGTGLTGVKLSWAQVENANSYNIQANLSSGPTKKITGFSLVQSGTTITVDLDERLLKKNDIASVDSLYKSTFQVQAVSELITSVWSEPVEPTLPTN